MHAWYGMDKTSVTVTLQLTSGVGVFAHVCEQTMDTLSNCCDNNNIYVQPYERSFHFCMPRLHLIHVARIQVVPTCIHLYRLSPSTCILYRRQNCRHGYMYPLVSASRTLLRTCIRRHVDGYKLLVRDVSGYMYPV